MDKRQAVTTMATMSVDNNNKNNNESLGATNFL